VQNHVRSLTISAVFIAVGPAVQMRGSQLWLKMNEIRHSQSSDEMPHLCTRDPTDRDAKIELCFFSLTNPLAAQIQQSTQAREFFGKLVHTLCIGNKALEMSRYKAEKKSLLLAKPNEITQFKSNLHKNALHCEKNRCKCFPSFTYYDALIVVCGVLVIMGGANKRTNELSYMH
jgi:hypothetical protein